MLYQQYITRENQVKPRIMDFRVFRRAWEKFAINILERGIHNEQLLFHWHFCKMFRLVTIATFPSVTSSTLGSKLHYTQFKKIIWQRTKFFIHGVFCGAKLQRTPPQMKFKASGSRPSFRVYFRLKMTHDHTFEHLYYFTKIASLGNKSGH